MATTNLPGWKTAEDFAEIVGKDASLIRRYCRLGTIKARRAGPVWLISESEIERFEKMDRPVGNPNFRRQKPSKKKS